jgi:hypothetical protein
MGMQTAWLLVHNCPSLVQIGHISTWTYITKNDVTEFLNFVRSSKLSIVLYPYLHIRTRNVIGTFWKCVSSS